MEEKQTSNWVVLKFGGTSVSSKDTWTTIVSHVKDLLDSDENVKVWVVVSALSQVTNKLLCCINDIENYKEHLNWIKQKHIDLAAAIGDDNLIDNNISALFAELEKLLAGIQLTGDNSSSKLIARVLSFGELLSSRFGHNVLTRLQNVDVSWVDARNCLVSDNVSYASDEDKYLNAYILPKVNQELVESQLASDTCRLAITQGFIARTGGPSSSTCVLSRGGGDVSGALFACMLNAKRFEVWTDVHGLFTADPRHVKNARQILELSYREAQELAAMGAKVLHPRSLVPASFNNIPVEIHNTMDFKNKSKFTKIVSADMLVDKDTTVMAISRRLDQVLMTLSTLEMAGTPGFLYRAFSPFDKHKVSIDLVACSQYSVSVTLDYIPGGVEGDTFAALLKDLESVAQVEVHGKCAVVSIVGRRLRTVLHHMADAFKELAQFNVLLLSESSEDLNLSFVVEQTDDIDQLVVKLHKVLLEEKRGLPSPHSSNSLFGKTLYQLLAIPPSTPVQSFIQRSSNLPAIPQLNLETVSSPNRTLQTLSAVGERNVATEIFDMTEILSAAQNLKHLDLKQCNNKLVLKTLISLNKNIVFILNTAAELETLGALSQAFDHPVEVVAPKEMNLPPYIGLTRSQREIHKESVNFLPRRIQATVTHIDIPKKKVLLNLGVISCSADRTLTFSYFPEQEIYLETPFSKASNGTVEDVYEVLATNYLEPFSAPKKIFQATFRMKLVQAQDTIIFSLLNNEAHFVHPITGDTLGSIVN